MRVVPSGFTEATGGSDGHQRRPTIASGDAMPQTSALDTPTPKVQRPREVIEIDGMLWKPKAGTKVTATSSETPAARG
jgi:hypothetical protein